MFPEKFDVFCVVSMGHYITDLVPKIDGWYLHETQALAKIEKIQVWRRGAIVQHSFSMGDLISILNKDLEV